MAKKQTRRSISVSRTTYERLKAFCEANNISMSQFVETRVGDFLGEGSVSIPVPSTPRPVAHVPAAPSAPRPLPAPARAFAAAPERVIRVACAVVRASRRTGAKAGENGAETTPHR